ncbi:WxcM-like domain-containing protein [Parabacteroides acidifaciens]|uniref:WxcM-like domain-containing protein n=1 Tax=Parabacteroides acidifaciens TaxID=2290935 RepID=A0A3D8HHV5_9BACT|nr:FdtA/QdtA family cupin domain-containing protein [Parabacteroides acidifaciens]MBC8600842.1 WxcM-like domain-containing protein [Parabacteroides acidifaciens]RDU50564.1 WxcM-like domain-containing protein [Parabacteroides acidifaciens]
MKTDIFLLPKIADKRGNLSFFEEENHLPFILKRVYWIYDVPGGEIRGGHAYRQNEEFIVALSGSFDVVISDGKQSKVYHLNRSYKGVYIPKMCWRELGNFSTNSVAFVAASTLYDETDYIRDYDEYKEMVK